MFNTTQTNTEAKKQAFITLDPQIAITREDFVSLLDYIDKIDPESPSLKEMIAVEIGTILRNQGISDEYDKLQEEFIGAMIVYYNKCAEPILEKFKNKSLYLHIKNIHY